MSDAHDALVALGRTLAARHYEFTSVTPSTHQRVLARAPQMASTIAADSTRAADDSRELSTLRDIFGWNKVFAPEMLPQEIFQLASRARAFTGAGQGLRASV